MSDRLGRSLGHLLQLLGEFDANGVRLLVHDMAIDTSTPQGKLFFSMVVGDAPRKGLIIIGSAIAWDVMMVAFGFSRSFPLSLGLLFVMGIAAAAHENAIATVLQLSSAEHIRGRIMSLYHIADASFPLGFIAAAPWRLRWATSLRWSSEPRSRRRFSCSSTRARRHCGDGSTARIS